MAFEAFQPRYDPTMWFSPYVPEDDVTHQSSWRSPIRYNDLAGRLSRASAAVQRKSRSLGHRSTPTTGLPDLELYREAPLKRTFSFNSLSTAQRDAEAFGLSQYRDSPVSALGPQIRPPIPYIDHKLNLQDPSPPLPVVTLKDARRRQKFVIKSIKRNEKEQKKAEKAAGLQRKHNLAAQIAAEQARDALDHNGPVSTTRSRSSRLQSSIRTPKRVAAELVKKITVKRSADKELPHNVPQDLPVPTLDDFPTKPELYQYLHPEQPPTVPEPETELIAELPATLPPYTPFQRSITPKNYPPVVPQSPVVAYVPPPVEVLPVETAETPADSPRPSSRPMRCDSCQFGIKVDESYFHCTICEGGDRILCSACDAAGMSCRHELTERTRRVLRYVDSTRGERPCDMGLRSRSTRRAEELSLTATGNVGLGVVQQSRSSGSIEIDSSGYMPKPNEHEMQQRKTAKELRELDLQRREQEIAQRERDATNFEREARSQERQAMEREREAMARERELMHVIRMESTRQQMEMACGLGSQFTAWTNSPAASSSIVRSESQKSAGGDIDLNVPSDTKEHEDSLFLTTSEVVNVLQPRESAYRSHPAKRKASASGPGPTTPSRQQGSRSTSSRSLSHRETDGHDDDEEDTGSGSPKKQKQSSDNASVPEKLFACHFCKHDINRYSERNTAERQYRGCSSGFWPDISRLKQHLYRVHWRGYHCQRCWAVFKDKDLLDQHLRQAVACQLQECTYPEKFTDVEYNDIRRKRPGRSPEDVWFTIFSILFPGIPHPQTPYADNMSQSAPAQIPGSPAVSQSFTTWETLGETFEARLNQNQDIPDRVWLRLPGVREFLRQQLRDSIADVVRQVLPETNSVAHHSALARSPSSGLDESSRQLSSLHIPTSPVPALSNPTSATSTTSHSSQWLLPSHRRSFSRPFVPRSTQGATRGSEAQVVSPRSLETSPMDTRFKFPTHHATVDPEYDQYDEECESWQKGDEGKLAVAPQDFNFEFNSSHMPVSGTGNIALQDQRPTTIPQQPSSSFRFKPVKISSLADEIPHNAQTATDLKANYSNASLDSGYGSFGSRPSSSRQVPLAAATVASSSLKPAVKRTCKSPPLPQSDRCAPKDLVDVDVSMELDTSTESAQGQLYLDQISPLSQHLPIADHGLNLDALCVPFQEFLGAEMDEMGNVAGKSLTEYLDARYPVRSIGGEDTISS